MEGAALTPDGMLLVGMMQANLNRKKAFCACCPRSTLHGATQIRL